MINETFEKPHAADDLPLARISTMLEEMRMLVRDAVAAQPVSVPASGDAENPDELGMVEAMIQVRRERCRQFPADWFSNPAWDILLFLFESHLKGVKLSVGDVGTGTDNRPTTAIRWLDIIEAAGMLDRRRCVSDSRRVYVILNDRGVAAMRLYFASVRSKLPTADELAN